MRPRRYEIFFANLDPSVGAEIKKIRPVVIVSQNEMNKFLDTVVICPLTSQIHLDWKTRIQISCAGRSAEIAVDQIRTISKQRLMRKIDTLDETSALKLRMLITEMYGE